MGCRLFYHSSSLEDGPGLHGDALRLNDVQILWEKNTNILQEDLDKAYVVMVFKANKLESRWYRQCYLLQHRVINPTKPWNLQGVQGGS